MNLPINKSQSTKVLDLRESFRTINQKRKKKGKRPLTKSEKEKISDAVGEIAVEQIQKHLDKGQSPVHNGEYKRTLADGRRISRLFDEGDMRSQITHTSTTRGTSIGIFKDAPEIDRLKASGHNKGDSANGVQREFIPDIDGRFNDTIERKIKTAINNVQLSRTALEIKNGD